MHGHLPKNSKYAHVREASWYDCILQTTSLLQKMERESIFIVWILLLSPWVEGMYVLISARRYYSFSLIMSSVTINCSYV